MSRCWRYRCRTCGEELESWAAAERHGDTHHGARLELIGIGLSTEWDAEQESDEP